MDGANILRLIKTKEEQSALIDLVENLISNLYKSKLKSKVSTQVSPFKVYITNEITKTIQALKISEDKSKTEKFLDSFLLSTRNLNTLKISIAIEPNQQILNNLKRWADKNGMNNTVFEIIVDPTLIGGAVIANKKGAYADYSVLKRMNDLFSNQKQEILKLL